MKSKELLIATALILLFGTVLSGCQTEGTALKGAASEKKTVIEQLVAKAIAAKKEVHLKLVPTLEGKTLKVEIKLENPNLKPLASVQLWLSYDPAKLKGKSIDTKGSAFDLPAPYANEFDSEKGLMMLGRANTSPIREKSVLVAVAEFEMVGEGTTMIDAYDYRDDLSGHVSANILVDGKPFNILVKPESPALVIE